MILQWNHTYTQWGGPNKSIDFTLPITAPTRNAVMIAGGTEATGVNAIAYNIVNSPTNASATVYGTPLSNQSYTGVTHIWLFTISY